MWMQRQTELDRNRIELESTLTRIACHGIQQIIHEHGRNSYPLFMEKYYPVDGKSRHIEYWHLPGKPSTVLGGLEKIINPNTQFV